MAKTRLEPIMQNVLHYVAAHPGTSMADATHAGGPDGYAAVRRCLSSGLLVRDDRDHGRHLGLYLTTNGLVMHNRNRNHGQAAA